MKVFHIYSVYCCCYCSISFLSLFPFILMPLVSFNKQSQLHAYSNIPVVAWLLLKISFQNVSTYRSIDLCIKTSPALFALPTSQKLIPKKTLRGIALKKQFFLLKICGKSSTTKSNIDVFLSLNLSSRIVWFEPIGKLLNFWYWILNASWSSP